MNLLAALFIGALNLIGGESSLSQGNQKLTILDGSSTSNPARFPRDVEKLVPACAAMPCEIIYGEKYLPIPVVVSLKIPGTSSWAPRLQFKDTNDVLRARVDLKKSTGQITLHSLDDLQGSAPIPGVMYRAGDWLHLRLTFDIDKKKLHIQLQKTGDPKCLLTVNLGHATDLNVVVKNMGSYGCSYLSKLVTTLTTQSQSPTTDSALLSSKLHLTTKTFATSIITSTEHQVRKTDSNILLLLVALTGLVICEVILSVMLLLFVMHLQKCCSCLM